MAVKDARTEFDDTCLRCLPCCDNRYMYLVNGSCLRAHFCCFLCVLENKLINLNFCVKKVELQPSFRKI